MMPRWGGLLYIGETCSRCVAPAAFISFERATAFAVSLEPAPATTGTRPFTCSTVSSTTRRCSAGLIVTASPVDPHGTRKSIPSAICQSISPRSAFSSSAPSLVNGVTSAVPHPLSFSATKHVLHREDALLSNDPFCRQQRAVGEYPPIARHMLQSDLLEGAVEDQLMRARHATGADTGDRNR